MQKLIFTNNELLNAKLEVAHYGELALKNVVPEWKLTHADGSIIYNEKLKQTDLPVGKITVLDSISNHSI